MSKTVKNQSIVKLSRPIAPYDITAILASSRNINEFYVIYTTSMYDDSFEGAQWSVKYN